MLEVDFQKKIIDAIKTIGGYGFKLSNRYLRDVPDLLIVYKDTYLIEVKKGNLLSKSDNLNIKITPGQKNKIEILQKSGANCGLIILCEMKINDKTKHIIASTKEIKDRYNLSEFKSVHVFDKYKELEIILPKLLPALEKEI